MDIGDREQTLIGAISFNRDAISNVLAEIGAAAERSKEISRGAEQLLALALCVIT